MLKKYFQLNTIYFLIAFIIAAFLRLYRLEAFATFLSDQGRDAIIIKRLITFEHLPFIGPPSSIGQVFLGPFYYYLVAPFLPLFHFNPVGLAFAVAFYSLVGLAVIYFILKKEFNATVALLFTILVTFSYVNIDLSRFSWNPNLLPVFAFFTLYFWYKTITTNNWKFAVLFGIFFGFSFQLHHLTILLGPTILLSLILYTWKKISLFEVIKKIAVSIVSFLVVISPLILFDLKNHFLNTSNLIKTFMKGDLVGTSVASKSISTRFIETIAAALQNTFNTKLPFVVFVLIFIVFLGICIWLYKKNAHVFLRINILNIFLFIFSFSLLNSERHPHYFTPVYYSILFVCSYLLYELQKNKMLRFILIPIVIAGYIFLNGKSYYFFFQQPNNQIKGAEQIADSIIPHIKQTPYQLTSFPFYVGDSFIRYFLEIKGHRPLDYDSPAEGQEFYVLCFYNTTCQLYGNKQWQMAVFKNPKLESKWNLDIVTIYKLVHAK